MPFLMPNTGPPMSRAAVNPRSSISRASSAAFASRDSNVALGASISAWLLALMKMCTWLSIMPGISVRPLPAIRVTAVAGGLAIGAVEIVLITLPLTSTFAGADSRVDVPSKIRTFSKITAVAGGVWAKASVAGARTRSESVTNALTERDGTGMDLPPGCGRRAENRYTVLKGSKGPRRSSAARVCEMLKEIIGAAPQPAGTRARRSASRSAP